jgi:DDE superfamily endonuclease
MVGRMSDWKEELRRFLEPFLARLGHKARRQMCPLYVSGLIGPGDRKSIQPMAERLALGGYDQLHHFIAAGVWDATPVETDLWPSALVGLSFGRLKPSAPTSFELSQQALSLPPEIIGVRSTALP